MTMSKTLLRLVLFAATLGLSAADCSQTSCTSCSSSTCLACAAGSYLYSNGNCYGCSYDGCTCSSYNECNDCLDGYYRSNGYCSRCYYRGCTCNNYYGCNGCILGYYGYYSFNTLRCRQCDDSCRTCTTHSTTCTSCNDGAYLQTGSCNICPLGCRICTSQSMCTHCKSGYFLRGNTCQGCSTGCSSCTGDDSCVSCYSNYSLRGSVCCPNTCTSCTSVDQCLSCAEGYQLNNGKCCPPGCSSCDHTGQCPACEVGYYLNHLKCWPCQTGCSSCTSSYQCSQCTDQFTLRGSICCPSTCTTCTSATSCSACVIGHYGSVCQNSCPNGCINSACDQTGACIQGCTNGYHGVLDGCPCPENCKNDRCSADTGYCTGCENGYFGNKCDRPCNNNCTICTSVTECQYCKSGRYSGDCSQQCPGSCGGNSCYQDTGDCLNCPDGFYGERCTNPCSGGCKRCTGEHSCSQCDEGYYVNGSTCIPCTTGCKSCSSTTCSSCKERYYRFFTNGVHECRSCDEGCANCTATSCNLCSAGYYRYRVSTNTYIYSCNLCEDECEGCSSSGCDQCQNGYYKRYDRDGEFYSCSACQDECQDCYAFGCNQCKNGFYKHYDSATGTYQCYNCSTECQICTSATVCSTCQERYYIAHFYQNNGYGWYCKSCVSNCLSCTSDSDCNQCEPGYYGSLCQHDCPQNCKKTLCTKGTGTCSLGCVDGFFGDTCTHFCLSGCKSCTDEFTCIDCKAGYIRVGDTCEPDCPVNCNNSECSDDKEQCTSGCNRGKFGSKCDQNCTSNCLVCDQYSGQCTECVDGYYGKDCSSPCSAGCSITDGHLTCNIEDGYCNNGCSPKTKHGSQCNKNCSENCAKLECLQDTGKCVFGCGFGYHGNTCSDQCSEGCVTGGCHDSNGTCVEGCSDGYEGDTCVKTSAQTGGPGGAGATAGAAVGAVVGVLIIVGIIVGIFLYRRRQARSSEEKVNGRNVEYDNAAGAIYVNGAEAVNVAINNTSSAGISNPEYAKLPAEQPVEVEKVKIELAQQPEEAEDQSDEDEDGILVLSQTNFPDTNGYYNVGAISRPVKLTDLPQFVATKSADKLKDEFEQLPKGLTKPYAESRKQENVTKNRYKEIYPYDDTRVVLKDGGPDYINASYLDGYEAPKAYIAALGPVERTLPDIWRMVWQEHVGKIVMLTKLMELGTKKCEQYWPDEGHSQTYGGIGVTTEAENVFAEFTIRMFSLFKKGVTRKVTHIHYTAWPDKGVPDDVTGLVEFRQKVLATTTTQPGPTLVHCSAGIGRTGTFIALDYLTKEGEAEGSVNIQACVLKLREQRVNMVQTAEQYTYLHHAVVHSLTFDCRNVTGDLFQAHYLALLKPVTGGASKLEARFKQLQATIERKKCDEESIAKNKTFHRKNRDAATIPADRYRPRLRLSMKPGASDYINAVFLNGYVKKNGLIITQTPLPDTAVDFWKLVFQEKVQCIVMMDGSIPDNKTASVYWPAKSEKITFGMFTIKKTKSDQGDGFFRNSLEVEYRGQNGPEVHILQQFMYKGWPESNKTPLSASQFVAFMDSIEDAYAQSRTCNLDSPVVIHCLGGAERSGLFCAVSILIEKMKIEQEVSVVNTVRTLKSRRPQIIPNVEQYSFCHEAVNAYLESFNTYSNFQLRFQDRSSSFASDDMSNTFV